MFLVLGIKSIKRIFFGDIDRQSGGETITLLFLFGAVAAVVVVAATTDIFGMLREIHV